MAEWKEQCAAAKAYEAEKDRVRQASGFSAARAVLYRITGELRHICDAIANVDARTLAGLSIKASAVNAWMETEHATFIDTNCTVWVMALLVSVLRLDGRDPKRIDDALEHYRSVEHYTWEAHDPAKYDI